MTTLIDCGQVECENKAVWKYPVSLGEMQHVIPEAGKILDVQIQGGAVCMWVEVHPDNTPEHRSFHVVGTGHQEIRAGWDYVATFQIGPFVWHLYEDRHARSINQEKTSAD